MGVRDYGVWRGGWTGPWSVDVINSGRDYLTTYKAMVSKDDSVLVLWYTSILTGVLMYHLNIAGMPMYSVYCKDA